MVRKRESGRRAREGEASYQGVGVVALISPSTNSPRSPKQLWAQFRLAKQLLFCRGALQLHFEKASWQNCRSSQRETNRSLLASPCAVKIAREARIFSSHSVSNLKILGARSVRFQLKERQEGAESPGITLTEPARPTRHCSIDG